ncbi:MAG: hypothetical protein AAF790_11785, partial [Planctomycetota bacterium]
MTQPLETIVAPWEAASSEEASTALRHRLRRHAVGCVRAAFGGELTEGDPAADGYTARMWSAVLLHLQKQEVVTNSVDEVLAFIAGLEAGRLHYGTIAENVIEDVMVAQGLQLHDNRAARAFQQNYMPRATQHAQRFGGARGVDAVENLAAELVLPRKDRPPKIATYRGLTPLRSWLRSVVVNQCVSTHRGKKEVNLSETYDAAGGDTVTTSAFAVECEVKLAPAFRSAVEALPLEDRVLLKMLILDGASQKAMAASLGVNSGTLTRRKQKAAAGLLARVKEIGTAPDAHASVRECLELLLAGDVAALQK